MSNRTHVYIALTQDDLNYAQEHVKRDDLIITDLISYTEKCSIIRPFISLDEEDELSKKVKNWFFAALEENNLSPDVYGYVNNFFECSIRPAVMFLAAVDKANEDYRDVTFVLPSSGKNKSKHSTYFMAEHESAGIHLYNRGAVLGPYIQEYVRDKYQCINYQKRKLAVPQRLKNYVRIWGVLAARFFVDLKRCVKANKKTNENESNADIILILRTIGQSSVVMPFLKNTSHNVNVLISDSSIDANLLGFLEGNLGDNCRVSLLYRQGLGIADVFKTYLSVCGSLLKNYCAKLKYRGVNFDLTQALSETIVMSGGLLIYKEQIRRTMATFDSERSSLLLSMEQKSPHAFIDSIIAKEHSLPSAQIKQCNQSYTPLPEPIFSGGFVCDTPDILEKFKLCWPDYIDKLFYIGTFQGIVDRQFENAKNQVDDGDCQKICLFSGVHSNINIETIRNIQSLKKQTLTFNLTVKLHPRDHFQYNSIFPDVDFIRAQEMSFNQFCSQFDFALTYPSGVVGELMFNSLPFFIYKPDHRDYREIGSSFDPKGIMIAEGEDQFFDILSDPKSLKEEFLRAREEFMYESGLILDINVIDSNIRELSNVLGDY